MIIVIEIGQKSKLIFTSKSSVKIKIEKLGFIWCTIKNKKIKIEGNEWIAQLPNEEVEINERVKLEYTEFYCPFDLFFFEAKRYIAHYEHLLLKKTVTIGTENKSDIQLFETLGKMKLKIAKNSEGVMISNEGSSATLRVNQMPVTKTYLEEGDCIQYLFFIAIYTHDFLYCNAVKKTLLKPFAPQGYLQLKKESTIKVSKDYQIKLRCEPQVLLGPALLQVDLVNTLAASSVPQLIMAMSALTVALFSVFRGLDQQRSWMELIPMMIFPLAMIFSAVLWPKIEKRRNLRSFKNQLKKRDTIFYEEIDLLRKKITLIHQEIRQRQTSRYPKHCDFSQIMNENFLFQRTENQLDFLYLLLGKGEVKSLIQIQSQKKNQIRDHELELIKIQEELQEWASICKESLVEIDLKEIKYLSIISNRLELLLVFRNVVSQLLLMHHPNSCHTAFYLDEEWGNSIQDFLYFPHCYSSSMNRRFVLFQRKDFERMLPFLLETLEHGWIIFFVLKKDDISSLDTRVLNHSRFVIIQFCSRIQDIHEICKMAIDLTYRPALVNLKNGEREKFESILSSSSSISMVQEIKGKIIEGARSKNSTNFGLLSCFECNQIEELGILERWQKEKGNSLIALLGKEEEGYPITMDLHEGKDGPHGLVAGATGSGKSEFLLSLILSLSIEYSPKEIQFVLLDYKGGSSILPLSHGNIHLPHLTATITNQDGVGIERSLKLLKMECLNRQKLFLKTSQKIGQSISDIDRYRQLYSTTKNLEPLAHLFVIVDEFAELKKEKPQFLQELISMARLGRSLGIHLILATQKPSGIVDEQILSNINFKVCLKVQEEQDSREVIHSNKAARITEAGMFYLLSNRQNTYGKAAYCHIFYPNKPFYFNVLDKTLEPIQHFEEKRQGIKREIELIIPELMKVAKENNYCVSPLWHSIPTSCCYLNFPQLDNQILLGVLDDLENRKESLYYYNYSIQGNCIIYSKEESKLKSMQELILQGLLKNAKEKIELIHFYKRKTEDFIYSEQISLLEKKDCNQCVNRLLKRMKESTPSTRIFVFIDDLSLLLEEPLNDGRVIRLLKESTSLRVHFIALISSFHGIRQQVFEPFECKLTLESISKTDQLILFNSSQNETYFKGLVYSKKLMSFTYCLPNNERLDSSYVAYDFKLWKESSHANMTNYTYSTFPLGVSVETGELIETTGRKPVLITGLYEDSLNAFKKQCESIKVDCFIDDLDSWITQFKNFKEAVLWIKKNKAILFVDYQQFKEYSIQLKMNWDELVWIGNGFTSQSLIFSSQVDYLNLKDREGVVCVNGRSRKIRLFDE